MEAGVAGEPVGYPTTPEAAAGLRDQTGDQGPSKPVNSRPPGSEGKTAPDPNDKRPSVTDGY